MQKQTKLSSNYWEILIAKRCGQKKDTSTTKKIINHGESMGRYEKQWSMKFMLES